MKIYYQPTNDEKKLKVLHKFYDQCLDHYQKITVNLMESLDSIYPFYKRIFSEFDSTNSLKFLQTFPHPGLILIHKPETIAKRFKELTSHSLEYSKKIVEKLLELISKTMPGCRVDSFEVEILRDLATQALFYKQRLDKIQNEMKSLAATSKTQLFNLIKSIPGVGDNLTSRFIAEVMNLDRFRSSKALIAYAGTDPHISQSGKISGEHLSITKYGNKKLRNIVFLMVRSMTKNKAESTSVKDYYYKKKTQPGFVPKVALVACINKLLTIIYLMNKNSQVFIY